ncbi:hypothetical protein NKOR_01860 [Candidatus Nitrosopumilus koreensis AR1]|uniref:Uncharacterized protein n=2 Tax=Nitrosopumilaceae TaxID=338190 RepID=K0B2M0_9ARCH|nr:hypothetical protein NKOR_01860 [Candidatus Nitrosopumilus koreensis AR1]
MAILATGVLAPALPYSNADIIPPKHQTKIGISDDDVVCDSGLFKVIRAASDSVACVKAKNVSKLVANGWAKTVGDKPVDEELLSKIINRKSIDLATINILETVPIKSSTGTSAPGKSIASYDVVFEICASVPIYAPDINISSDSETKQYELANMLESGVCTLSATKLKATDPKSIKIIMLNKGDISEKIVALQSELDSLKEKLAAIRASMKPTDPDAQKQGKQIADLRKQINEKREQLHRILFTIHHPPTVKNKINEMTFSGKVIEGNSASVLSVLDATQTPGLYDAIFEVCAGPTTIKLPVIKVTSDKQSQTVKLGDKITSNSCQMTSVKIEANDKSTIAVTPAGNADSSKKASDLEVQINSLQKSLITEKQTLKSLIHNPDRPENFADLVDTHVVKITELRNQISMAKAEFNKIMYMTYN